MGSKRKVQGGSRARKHGITDGEKDQAPRDVARKRVGVPDEIVSAFRSLIQEFGAEVEPLINIAEFWRRDEYLSYWQEQLQDYISKTYLPDFAFESRKHFQWHFQQRDDPFLLLRGRSAESYFETWLRAIMVPRSVHYRAEVAAALQRWELKYRPRLEYAGKWTDSMSWKTRTRRVFHLAAKESGYEPSADVDLRSVLRWSEEVQKWRNERASGPRPSGWCIDCIEFAGDEQLRHNFEQEHFDVPTHLQGSEFYRETWIWNPIPGRPVPLDDSITFGKPATSNLWLRRWKAKKARP